jgi:tRNA(Glu) U13 pseudouridine synthase TruD
VQLDRKAAVDVMNYTKEAIGRHFVLVINDAAVGIMPIDSQVVDGNLIFHVEKKGMTNTQAVMDISRRLNISALKIRKIKESERP